MAYGTSSETVAIQKKMKAREAAKRKAARTRASNKARKAALEVLKKQGKTGAAQRAMTGRAASGMMSRLAPALTLGTIGAEIAQEVKKEARERPIREARSAEVAKNVTAMSPKDVREAKPGQSPTDMLRARSTREVVSPAKRAATRYTIKAGDTLSEIAKKNKTTIRAIMEASGIKNANEIRVGQKIKIPDAEGNIGPYGKITEEELKSGKYNTSKTPKFGRDYKKGGKISKSKSKPRGCGAALRGYGKAMKGGK